MVSIVRYLLIIVVYNMYSRKRIWIWESELELFKDYDVTIQYHLGKANVVADALSQKAVSVGGLACLSLFKWALAKEIQT